jgi:hypothetical protein
MYITEFAIPFLSVYISEAVSLDHAGLWIRIDLLQIRINNPALDHQNVVFGGETLRFAPQLADEKSEVNCV